MDIHDVYSIAVNDGLWTVDYSVTPGDGPMERCKITRGDRPHPDFMEPYFLFKVMAVRFLELPLVNSAGEKLGFIVKQIKFSNHNKLGLGG